MHRLAAAPVRAILAARNDLALLFVLAALARILYSFGFHPDALIWADEVTYDRIALQLAKAGRYESHPYDAAPGWPALLAVVYAAFGHDHGAARLAQALLGGVLAIAVASTGALLFGRRAGLLAGVGVALYPPLIYLAAVLYADHLAAVLLALTVCALARWQHRPGLPPLVVAGALLGATALTRPVYLLLVPVATIYVALQAAAGRRIRQATILAAVAVATIAPWTIRNAAVFESFVPVSTGFGLHLWRGNNGVALGNADDRHLLPLNDLWLQRAEALPPDARERLVARTAELAVALERLDPVQQDARLRTEAWHWIRTHPITFARLSMRRVRTLYSPFSHTMSRNGARSGRNILVATLSLIALLALGLPGAVIALRLKPGSWIIHAAILAPTAIYAVLTAATRFRLPIDALWILLVAVAVDRLLHGSAGRRRRDGAPRPPDAVPAG